MMVVILLIRPASVIKNCAKNQKDQPAYIERPEVVDSFTYERKYKVRQ